MECRKRVLREKGRGWRKWGVSRMRRTFTKLSTKCRFRSWKKRDVTEFSRQFLGRPIRTRRRTTRRVWTKWTKKWRCGAATTTWAWPSGPKWSTLSLQYFPFTKGRLGNGRRFRRHQEHCRQQLLPSKVGKWVGRSPPKGKFHRLQFRLRRKPGKTF